MTSDSPQPGGGRSRRKFVSVSAAAAAGFLLTSCGPKRLYEVPPDRLKEAIQKVLTEVAVPLGVGIGIKAASG